MDIRIGDIICDKFVKPGTPTKFFIVSGMNDKTGNIDITYIDENGRMPSKRYCKKKVENKNRFSVVNHIDIQNIIRSTLLDVASRYLNDNGKSSDLLSPRYVDIDKLKNEVIACAPIRRSIANGVEMVSARDLWIDILLTLENAKTEYIPLTVLEGQDHE